MNEPSSADLPLLDGRFQLEQLLGRGGMAEVYRASDLRQGGRHVAVKILRDDVVDSVGVERFRREIALASEFTHPHILGLFESGETRSADGQRVLFYVMPLVEGETLGTRLDREDHLPLHDAVRITREVLEALKYAHDHGVIHRDIKPANILLSGGHAVVADFGVARPIPRESVDGSTSVSLTVSGVAVGTPAYMSPEQAFATSTVDTRCDLYAAGCVFYEMLTGRAPFEASTGQAVMARKMSGAFVPPSVMRPGLPAVVDEITSIALRPDPADRFASATAFLDALGQIGETGPMRTTTERSRTPPRPRWRRPTIISAITVVLVLAVGTWLWSQNAARARSRGVERGNAAFDPARVAVLGFENLSADSSLTYIANGITADLRDQLAQVHTLTVVSKDGISRFLQKNASTDSLARVLRVGTIITGDVRPRGDKLSIAVRLVDGGTNQIVATHDNISTREEILAVQSSVVDDVSRFLRERLGEQIRLSTSRQRASNAQAWQLVERARELREGELAHLSLSLSDSERSRQFRHVDSLAELASRLDRRWAQPVVERAMLALVRAPLEEAAAHAGAFSLDSARHITRGLWRDAVRFSDDAVARDSREASAFRARGRARMELWRTSESANDDSLRVLAEADLRSAVDKRPEDAGAWNDLSNLLTLGGDFADAELAAANALKADEYLTNRVAVLARLQYSALAAEDTLNAKRWCAEGLRLYPTDERFFTCEFTTLGWTANRPEDVGRAWRALGDAENRFGAARLPAGWPRYRFFVAAIAARAGMRDSALAIVAGAHALLPKDTSNVTGDFSEANVRALVGERDETIRLLRRYLARYPIQRRMVARMPWFRALRNDPEFIAMTSPISLDGSSDAHSRVPR